MVNPNNHQLILNLHRDQIAFPQIDYTGLPELQRQRTTLFAAYTTIQNCAGNEYLQELNWNANGNIEWQLQMLEHISTQIFQMIVRYNANPDNELLIKIFLWIQLWGGNSGRSIFVRGQGWPNNFNGNRYAQAVDLVIEGNYQQALEILNNLYGISTAFSTKHIHFWSDGDAPIYDSIIAAVVFGRKISQVRSNEYTPYIDALDQLIVELNDLGHQNITRSMIERNLFNWADTEQGLTWRMLRLNGH